MLDNQEVAIIGTGNAQRAGPSLLVERVQHMMARILPCLKPAQLNLVRPDSIDFGWKLAELVLRVVHL